jgi:hypothetical protein
LKSKTFVDRNYILSKTPGNDQKFATINATSTIGYYVVFWNPSTWLRNRSKRVGARPLENERGMDIVFSQPRSRRPKQNCSWGISKHFLFAPLELLATGGM